MIDSTTVYDDNDYLELVWKNGQVVVQGGSSRATKMNTPLRTEHSSNPYLGQKANHRDSCIAEGAKLGQLHGNSCQLKDGSVISRSVREWKLTTENGCLCPCCKQERLLPSDTFKKPRMDSSARVNEIKATMVAAEVAVGATSSKGTDGSAVTDASNHPRRDQEPLPCKQSEAVGHNSSLRTKRKDDTNFCDEPLLQSSSACSLVASNNPDISKQAETDVSTHISENDEDTVKETDAREAIRVKRSRNAETHNLSERKRRDKINKKLRVLRELIPNCNKVDKASMLDDAIEYLKTLKLQLQMMSIGAGLCMPLMMLHSAPHQMMKTPHLPQLMGAGMGFRPQFSIPPLPAAVITDNRVGMFGFPNQFLPMPMSHHSPFIPMVGKLSSTQLPLQATCTATSKLAENLASAHQLATLKVSAPNKSAIKQ